MDEKRASLVVFGVILIMILLAVKLAVPTLVSSADSDGTQTFSNGGISFEYPQNLSESPVILNQIISGDFMGIISGDTLGELISVDGNYEILVQKYNLSDFGTNSSQDVLYQTITGLNDSNTTILNETTRNVNGITINEILFSTVTPDNTNQETLFVILAKDQKVYMLQFNSISVAQDGANATVNPTAFNDSMQTFQEIISNIKVE
jgi:hypothetical protein